MELTRIHGGRPAAPAGEVGGGFSASRPAAGQATTDSAKANQRHSLLEWSGGWLGESRGAGLLE